MSPVAWKVILCLSGGKGLNEVSLSYFDGLRGGASGVEIR